MKKFIQLIGLTAVALAVFTGCGVGTPPTRSSEITDKEVIAQMEAQVPGVIDQYFGVNIDDGIKRERDTIKTEFLVDEETATYKHLSNILQETAIEDPIEGQIYSYGVVFSPDNTEIQGAIVGQYSAKVTNKYTDEELQGIAKQFILDKQIVEDPDAWVFERVDDSVKEQNFQIVVYNKDKAENLLVGVSMHTGQVMYFERVPDLYDVIDKK